MQELNYKWTLKDAKFTKDRGKVFSCFACGGGSTMGYKLAGFDVIGCNEIDPRMAEVYKANHNPKYCYIEPIQDFKNREDLPQELYNLDILDGSPPCSSFSMAGNRGKDWGKEKKFREGQAEQVLDTLFFDFIELGKKLQPKIIIAENVKGLLLGDAKSYLYKILEEFDKAGYYVSYKLLNAKDMGIPQRRERVFFTAIRKDIYKGLFVDLFQTVPYLELEFREKEMVFKNFKEKNNNEYPVSDFYKTLWNERKKGDASFADINGRVRDKENTGFGTNFLYDNKVCGTLTTKKDCYCLFDEPRYLSDFETKCVGSYPQDYNFLDNKPQYLIGMSVPPLMIARVIDEVFKQWVEV